MCALGFTLYEAFRASHIPLLHRVHGQPIINHNTKFHNVYKINKILDPDASLLIIRHRCLAIWNATKGKIVNRMFIPSVILF
jgi:hypothetical protein